MLRPEVRHIFRMERPTNFNLGTQTEDEDPHQRQALSPPRSKVKVERSLDASDSCWPISRERNDLETPKLVVYPTGDIAHQFQGQRSKVKVTRPT